MVHPYLMQGSMQRGHSTCSPAINLNSTSKPPPCMSDPLDMPGGGVSWWVVGFFYLVGGVSGLVS